MWLKSYICTSDGARTSFDTSEAQILRAIEDAIHEGKKFAEIPMYDSNNEPSKEKFYVFVDHITSVYTKQTNEMTP